MSPRTASRHCIVVGLALASLDATACRDTPAPGPRPASSTSLSAGDAAPDARPSSELVTFRTSDAWTLSGELSRRDRGPTVVLVHQLSSNRGEWAPLLSRLHTGTPTFTTLAIDLRGHGASTTGPDGATTWQSFGNDPTRWSGVVLDVEAALRFVADHVHESTGVILVGSSIGGSAALRAAGNNLSVAAVALLSPGLSYRGIDTLEPMRTLLASHRPALLIASEGDTYASDSVRRLAALDAYADGGARPNGTITVDLFAGTGAHGVSIGAPGVHPEMFDRIDAWIRRVAVAAPPASP